MADLRDFTKKNPIFVGTDGLRLPSGNSAQRVASANVNGTMRFNTDIAGMEMYTPTGWIPFASPPSISTVTPSTYSGESGTQFILNGAGFTSDAQVYFITSNGTTMLATTVSFIGSAELRATTPRAIRVQEEPISVRVNQQSGIATKVDCIDAGGVPNWITTAGTLGSIFGANTVNVYVSATDPEGTSVTYQITSGSLPGGLNFTTANGLIQGLASSVLANTTYNFTIKANDTVSNNTDRSFSYTVLNRAPVINTAAGSLGTIYSGNAASASISAYDPDGGQLTYSVSSGTLPVNSSLGSANGVITGTPVVVTTNTTYSFTLTSTDEGSLTASNNYTYTVLNRPPLINTAAGSLGTIVSGNAISTTIDAYDPDGAAVSFAITSGNLMATANIGSSNGTITASNSLIVLANTTYTFTVRATDVGEMSVSNTYTYTVLNRPPLWNTAATLTTINGADPYTPITVNAYDPDGGSVTYSLTSGSVPSGLSFVSANATITGAPDEVFSNTTSTFTLTVTDPGSDANARTFSLTVTPAIDNQFANTILLLKTTSNNTALKDASSNNQSLVPVADVRPSNFGPFSNSWSANFGAGEGNLYWADSSAFTLGSGDFAIEFWWWPTSVTAEQDMFGQWSSGDSNESWLLYSGTTTTGFIYVTDGATDKNVTSSTRPTVGRWNHICVCRNSNTISYYINGTRTATVSESAAISDSSRIWCAGGRGGSSYGRIQGLISDFRIVKGYNPYNATSASLTVPTAPLTAISGTSFQLFNRRDGFTDSVTGAVPTFVDTVSMVATSPFADVETTTANGSMYFDGTGDYVSINSSTPLQLTTATPFTIEAWIYPTVLNGDNGIIGKRAGQGSGIEWQFFVKSSKQIVLWNGSSDYLSGSTISGTNSWSHVAVSWDLTTLRFFIDGVLCSSTHTGISLGTAGSSVITLGGNYPSGELFTGYISNLRLVKGTAVYTSSFTPLTAPLTAIANTSLLTFQNRQPFNNHAFQDNSRSKTLITRNGNASQGTFTPFSAEPGKWSGYFDGTQGQSKILRYTGNAVFAFPGTFTIECWYKTTSTASKSFYGTTNESAWTSDGFGFSHNNGTFTMHINQEGAVKTWTASATTYDGNWHHVAFVRDSSNNIRCFYEGTELGTPYYYTSQLGNASFKVVIGAGEPGGNGSAFTNFIGYMSNFRITKGAALYSTTFTPSTTPLTTSVSGGTVSLLTCQSNRFLDNSVNSFTPLAGSPFVYPFSPFAPDSAYTTANTGGSLYLDGSGDYLLTPSTHPYNNPLNAFRTNPFSMEAWHYGTTTTGGGQLVSSRAGSINDAATISFYITGGQYSFYGNGNHVAADYVTGQWNHVVYTRDASSTLRLFINGKLANYETSFTPDITARQFGIGSLTNGGEILPACWASDIRLVSGYIPTAYQTSSTTNGTQIFTPPTAPLTVSSQGAQSNSVCLLMNFTDAAIIDVTGKNVIETSAAARANNTAYKFSPGSMSFDASSSTRLQLPSAAAPPLFNFGTSDHTIEFWMNPFSSGSQMCLFEFRNADTSGQGVAINYSTSRTIFVYMQGNRITSSALTNGTWNHVALVRVSNVYTLYVGGVSQGTWANSDAVVPPANRPIIGAVSDGSQVFDGLIQDVRVTRGARYTTNFTAPTRTFPNR